MSGSEWMGRSGGSEFNLPEELQRNSRSGSNPSGFDYPDQARISGGFTAGTDPLHRGGKIPARWTMPYGGYSQPILELPQNKTPRITMCINAFLGEPIINSASKLTTFMALEKMLLTVTAHCKEIPSWIPEAARQQYIDDYGIDNPAQIAAAYVKQECLALLQNLAVKEFFQNETLDVLVAGDGYINIASNLPPDVERPIVHCPDVQERRRRVEELKQRMAKEGLGQYNIFALQGLNPSAIWMYPDFAGRITNAKIVHLLGEGTWDLCLDNLIHLKPWAWNWTVYGVSHYISALRWVDLKFATMDSMFVNARRYVSPVEWLEVRGPEDPTTKASLPPTAKQMAWADDIVAARDADTRFILPAGWTWKNLGAEGKVLRTEMLLEKYDDAIRTAAQVSRTFTSGAANVPAYATSKLQAGVMYKAIAPLSDLMGNAIEGRILWRFCLFRGFFEDDGTVIAPKVEFPTMPIQGDDSVERKIQALAKYGWMSPQTAWEMEGLDPGLEMERLAMAEQGIVEPFRAISPNWAPSQSPDRYDELRDIMDEHMATINVSRAKGNRKVLRTVARYLKGKGIGDWKTEQACVRDLGAYLTQAHYIQQQSMAVSRRTSDPKEMAAASRDQIEGMHDKKTMDRAATVSCEVRNTVLRPNGVSSTALI